MPPEIQTQVSAENEEKAIRIAEIERKRSELRRRMEEASKARKSKTGFMTPERKKKLRLLLRKKAAEELMKEQERKAKERRWIIDERCGEPEDLEWSSRDDLIDVCEYYFQRILDCESEKWDLELELRKRAFEIAEVNSKVNDLRGKFQRPILKKVSKYENKFAKLQRKAAEFNFRNQLKMVKRHELFLLKEDDRRSQSHYGDRQSEIRTTKMSAKCASCKYPLTISDSVACYECTSYFHIDCAQLVGFPFYELSSDHNRNTFLCSTCQLLPLPSPQCDSDSDEDCAMPSRQLDYPLEGQGDFAQDMNEVKGTIQDLSDLCKDMLREINDLKSINLTLRCCVENLRHDCEERDRAFTDMKRRLEAIELNKITDKTNTIESTDWDVYRLEVENEESAERYSTPEPEIRVQNNLQDTNNLAQGIFSHTEKTIESETETEPLQKKNEKGENNAGEDEWVTQLANSETTGTEHESSLNKEKEGKNKKSDEFNLISELNADLVIQREENRHDWGWKENKAVELLEKAEEENESECEEEENDTTELEEGGPQGWEILEEEIQNETEIKQEPEVFNTITEREQEDFDDKEITEEQEKGEWAEKFEGPELFTEDTSGMIRIKREVYEEQEEDINEILYQEEESSEKYPSKTFKGEKRELKTEELSDNTVDEGEDDLESLPKEVDDDKLPEEHEGEVAIEGSTEGELQPEGESLPEGESHEEGYPCLEGMLHPEREPYLEGDQYVESELEVDEELRLGGESPVEGEVRPPGSPLPTESHTEEDLWEYLRDTVSSVHPATVEEFVQNLIGTLQHVPVEYLKPVIEANIKRTNSPSVTDGEHLSAPESVAMLGEEGELAATGESAFTSKPEGETPAADGETGVATVLSAEGDDAEGYSAVEAAV